MADSSSFFSAETYRVGDPIENLQLRVTLRKRGGTVTLAEESSAAKGYIQYLTLATCPLEWKPDNVQAM